ncbi:MAG: pyridoxal 5'-phosphate synthase lyase subunit PdxS, partial [Nitrososphaerales archaeon]
VNGCRDLGEALRRIAEGASMLRTKGEAGTGNVAEAVKHIKLVMGKIRELKGLGEEQLLDMAKEYRVPIDLVKETARLGRLPVVNFAAGGIATPADAALMMHLGADGVFVGSGIFKSKDPAKRAESIVIATTYWDDPKIVLEASKMISEENSMIGIDIKTLKPEQMMQVRGV